MKICPQCRRTYSDYNLNFCLDDGAVLIGQQVSDSSALPDTVLVNKPFDQNQTAGSNKFIAPHQFSMPPPARKSKTWLWVTGILGFLVLFCGGGFIAFFAWIASWENNNIANSNMFVAVNSKTPVYTADNRGDVQKIDLSKWEKNTKNFGNVEYKNNEFLMSSKEKGFYFVLVASTKYQTENATIKVTVRNVDEESSALGYGLIIHSMPTPLIKDYAFLIDAANRRYRIAKHSPKVETDLVEWENSTAINDGADKNVLEVRDKSSKMEFYINNQFITSVDSENKYDGGVPGIYSGDAVTIAFSNLEVRR